MSHKRTRPQYSSSALPQRRSLARWCSVPASAAGLCAIAACLALWAAPASARTVHVFAGEFGAEGTGPGQFKSPEGVAVNDATHDVYVVDRGNRRVQEFNSTGSPVIAEFNGAAAPSGAFVEPGWIAVDNSGDPLDPSKEDVYVADRGSGMIDKFSASGGYEGQITGTPEKSFEPGESNARSISGLTVDPSGGVWVDTHGGAIYSFSDALENVYVSKRTTEFGEGTGALAIGAQGNIYVNTGRIAKVDDSGKTLIHPFGDSEPANGVAFHPADETVYIDNEHLVGTNRVVGSIGVFTEAGAPVERFGSEHFGLSHGVAVDGGTGTAYVTDLESGRVVVYEAVHLPGVVAGSPSERFPRAVTLNGTVDPEGSAVNSCVFEYDTRPYVEEGEAPHGQRVACSPANPGSGSTPVPVSARLEGLTPQTAYYYRLVAENAASVPSVTGNEGFFSGPRLGGEYVTGVAATSATLHAPLDAEGVETSYYFAYGTSAAYGSFAPMAPPGADAGAAAGALDVSVHLDGLSPGTVYHYRLFAVQGGETFEEGDGTFSTQPAGEAFALADSRSWELVSPAEKHGTLIEPLESTQDQIQAASDGGAITYPTIGPTAGEAPHGHITWAQMLSRRGSADWSTQDLTLPVTDPEGHESASELTKPTPEYRLFSPDLSLAAVEPQPFGTAILSPRATTRTLYLRDQESGNFLPLVTPENVSPAGTTIEIASFAESKSPAKFWQLHFLAATPDLGSVLFKTPLALVPPAIDEETPSNSPHGEPQWNLYEWGDGKLELVNILPDGQATHGAPPPFVSLADEMEGESDAVGGAQRVVSANGQRVAWTWGDPYARSPNYMGLYVRDMVAKETVKIGGSHAVFQTMNTEGSRIFYTENGDLYEYDWATRTANDLTSSHGGGESSADVLQSVSDVSEDGSYVYFVANGVLAEGATRGACELSHAYSGATCNLYVLHDDGGEWEAPKLVAVLSSADEPDWFGDRLDFAPGLEMVTSRVSPDGRYLAFMSNRSLTGYDNRDAASGQPDEEVYLYDATTGRLVCASCNPTGARPRGVLDGGHELLVDRIGAWGRTVPGGIPRWLAGSIPGWDGSITGSTYQPRYLSDAGRLFFDSPDTLVPQDTNGLEDVYEYELPGTGSCTSASVTFNARSGGCVSLISSGTSNGESDFLDASESGDDVFFLTTAQLSSLDRDGSLDVYDAHVCTAATPCPPAPVSSQPCESGDSCKAAPRPQPPIFGLPPSATFEGSGNPVTAAPSPSVAVKPLTRAQKLARSLAVCRRKRERRKEHACERAARKHDSAVKSGRRSHATGRRSGHGGKP